jgi:hypothetical protein
MPHVCRWDILQPRPLLRNVPQGQHLALPGATPGATATGTDSSCSSSREEAVIGITISRAGVASPTAPGLFPDNLHLTWDASDAFAAQQQGLSNKRRLMGFYGNSQIRLVAPDGRCLTSPSGNSGKLLLAACTGTAQQVFVLPEPGGELRMLLAADLGVGWHNHGDIEVWVGSGGERGGGRGAGSRKDLGDIKLLAAGAQSMACCSGAAGGVATRCAGTHCPDLVMAAGSQLHQHLQASPRSLRNGSLLCCPGACHLRGRASSC